MELEPQPDVDVNEESVDCTKAGKMYLGSSRREEVMHCGFTSLSLTKTEQVKILLKCYLT